MTFTLIVRNYAFYGIRQFLSPELFFVLSEGGHRFKSRKRAQSFHSSRYSAARPSLVLPPSPVLRRPECGELLRGVAKVVWLHICATNREPVDLEKGFWQDDWGCFVIVYKCQKVSQSLTR